MTRACGSCIGKINFACLTRLSLVAAVLLGMTACNLPPSGNPPVTVPGYRLVGDIQLPGDGSRFDYESLDVASHRLYIAHLGASEVVVFDTASEKVLHVVPNIAGVHGVIVVPELDRVYATATDKDQVVVLGETSLQVVATVPTGRYPDGLAYPGTSGKIYVANEQGSSETVIDVRTNQRVATLDLGGEVGNTQYDPGSNRVYAAVQTRNEMVAIDPLSDRVIGRYPVSGCDFPHGVAMDIPARHRAFVACAGNAKLAVFDLRSDRVIQLMDVGSDPDVLALDTGLHRLYVAAESGVLTVFDVAAGVVRSVARDSAGANAHSVAVDPTTHVVYLPLTDVGGHPALRELAPT